MLKIDKKNFFFVVFLTLSWTASSGISDLVRLEGTVLGYDKQFVEISTQNGKIKLLRKDIVEPQKFEPKLDNKVSLKISTKSLLE